MIWLPKSVGNHVEFNDPPTQSPHLVLKSSKKWASIIYEITFYSPSIIFLDVEIKISNEILNFDRS